MSHSCCGSLVFVNVAHVFCRLSENQSLSQVTLKHLSLLTHMFPLLSLSHTTEQIVSVCLNQLSIDRNGIFRASHL